MELLKCPNCGSLDLENNGQFYACQHCGGKLERDASKVAATVSSGSSVDKLMERADVFWDLGRIEKAMRLYRQVLDIDPTHAKARARVK